MFIKSPDGGLVVGQQDQPVHRRKLLHGLPQKPGADSPALVLPQHQKGPGYRPRCSRLPPPAARPPGSRRPRPSTRPKTGRTPGPAGSAAPCTGPNRHRHTDAAAAPGPGALRNGSKSPTRKAASVPDLLRRLLVQQQRAAAPADCGEASGERFQLAQLRKSAVLGPVVHGNRHRGRTCSTSARACSASMV